MDLKRCGMENSKTNLELQMIPTTNDHFAMLKDFDPYVQKMKIDLKSTPALNQIRLFFSSVTWDLF